MRLFGRMRTSAFLTAGLLLLSACAETQFLFHTAKQVQRSEEGGERRGTAASAYKVGDPYQIGGKWHYPVEDYGYSETGIASWYGQAFDGLKTANGETFNMNALTAAHRTLPMPSAVRVVNLENGRSLVLRVNDRGPFARGRIIDVSRQAARMLGFEGAGTAKVQVEVLPQESQQLKVAALNGSIGAEPQLQVAAAPRVAVKTENLQSAGGVAPASNGRTNNGANNGANNGVGSVLRQARLSEPALPSNVRIVPVPATNIYIQVGAFSDLGNALRLRDRMYSTYPSAGIARVQFGTEELYRVRIGPFTNVDAADSLLTQLLNGVTSEARLVVE